MNHNTTDSGGHDPTFDTIIGLVFIMGAITFLGCFISFVYHCCHRTSLLALLWFKCIGHRFYSRAELHELSEELESL